VKKMPTCSYCGKKYEDGSGYTVFSKQGVANRYCSRKCERNAALKRKPTKLKWTEKYASKA